jgi:preprotein translocase subunit SecG
MIRISEEFVLSGTHLCGSEFEGDAIFLTEITWVLGTAWEILALSLAVWIAVKHFRELQRTSTRWAVGDCFTILLQTHVFYFAR